MAHLDVITDRPHELLASLRRLSDDELVTRLKGLAVRERRATTLLVAHLAELDTRDVCLRAGYSSLFTYCRDVLGLSDGEAYNRIEVARTARRFPEVLHLLCSGEVSLTAVRLLGPHLTPANHSAVLESARGKRKSEVEEIVARLSPRADVPACVRKLPATGSVSCGVGLQPVTTPVAWTVPEKPLSPGRYRYQLTIGASTLEKLRLAKDMLRHTLPSGDDEAILDRALTALLEELARKMFGGEEAAGSSSGKRAASGEASAVGPGFPGAPDSRHIPVDVKRAVWVRDLGRCAFVGTDGHRCGERAFVEFHHVRPYAVGGARTVENLELRCRRHNAYEERVYFARDPVDEPPACSEGSPSAGVSTQWAGSQGRSGTSSSARSGSMARRSGSTATWKAADTAGLGRPVAAAPEPP